MPNYSVFCFIYSTFIFIIKIIFIFGNRLHVLYLEIFKILKLTFLQVEK